MGRVPCDGWLASISNERITIMSNVISAKDYAGLRKLAATAGEKVSFNYRDLTGKRTSVNAVVDSTTLKEDSILTRDAKDKSYHRYLFSGLESDVRIG